MSRIVCNFSCGAASAVATKMVLDQFRGSVPIVILNAHIIAEHPDNTRFLRDCEIWFDHPIERVMDSKYGADPFAVWRSKRFIKSRNGAPCSRALKKDVLDAYALPGDVRVLGFTAEEADRADRWLDANNGQKCLTPLIDAGLSKGDCLALLDRAGIVLPEMYRMGYNNANCLGCPKGGQGYWNRIRRDFPEVFNRMVQLEEWLGPSAYLFYDRSTGERFPLSELPPTSGRHIEPEISCSAACELIDIDWKRDGATPVDRGDS